VSKKSRESTRTERAASVRREQAARERHRRLTVVAVVVVLLAVVIGAGVYFGRSPSSSANASGPLPPASAQGQSLVVGDNASAKLEVVVYEDFLCPYCREFESSSRSALHAAAEKGTVQVEYRPFHLLQDDYSTRALSAWAAVLQGGTAKQALRFHDLLYDKQPYESASDKPDTDTLADWAKQSGVTDSTVLAAVEKSDTTFVDAADAAAEKAGVSGTPTVFVNGKELQGTSVSDMVDRLEKMISRA
jgi:protein-disulfide isomerase